MNIPICIPSYKRPKVKTLEYIPWARVYVDESEFDDYVKANEGVYMRYHNIISCKKGIQGNVCRIRNHIMRTEFENGADAVVIVDDDMKGLYLWKDGGNHTLVSERIEPDWLMDFLEKYSTICRDLGFKMWGGNCNQDKMSYRTYSPFSFNGYLGSPFQCFIRGNECYHDERFSLKEDYDMTLQQCNKYRGCLRLNFLTYDVKQSEPAGGCATYRNLDREKEQFLLLQKKWGKDIVKEDKSNKGHSTKQKRFDYNPIIKVPIRGI